MNTKENKPGVKRRGFASLSPERMKEIARMGGLATPGERRSFSQDRTLAKKAGAKGGKAAPSATRSFSTNPELARSAGRKGGKTSGKARKKSKEAAQ